MQTLNILNRAGKLIRRERAVTLAQYIELDRLKSGQRIYLGTVNKHGVVRVTDTFFVGDATPYHAPSTNDGGFGWSEYRKMKLLVLEVHEFDM